MQPGTCAPLVACAADLHCMGAIASGTGPHQGRGRGLVRGSGSGEPGATAGARWGQDDPDFAVARDNLAARLGASDRGGGWLRDKLVSEKVIERTVPYKPNKAAARYRWLLDFRMEAL